VDLEQTMLEFYQQFYSKKRVGSRIYTAEYQNYTIACPTKNKKHIIGVIKPSIKIIFRNIKRVLRGLSPPHSSIYVGSSVAARNQTLELTLAHTLINHSTYGIL
jgi:hypothetical protein